MPENLPWLAVAVLIVALLYSSVGHAGASGYLAVMALFSLAPEVIKPTALVLNVLVAGIGTWHFWRAGHFSWRLFWPLAVLAVPLAFVGGYAHLPAHVFKILLGVVLLFSALRFLIRPAADEVAHEPARPGGWNEADLSRWQLEIAPRQPPDERAQFQPARLLIE